MLRSIFAKVSQSQQVLLKTDKTNIGNHSFFTENYNNNNSKKSFKTQRMWHFLSKFKHNYLGKMCGYPNFLAKICLSHIVINSANIPIIVQSSYFTFL